MDTIEEIHSSIDNAVDRLKNISTCYLEQSSEVVVENFSDDAEKLSELGFKNISKVLENNTKKQQYQTTISNKKKLKNKSISISQDIVYYSEIYPFHKFIYYSQLISICEKYNLVLGSVEFYNGDIPKKNSDEIINFNYGACDRNVYLTNELPIFKQTFRTGARSNLYICAPSKDFVKGLTKIGVEVFKGEHTKISLKSYIEKKRAPKDPIVLLPVWSCLEKQLGFIVISKWGLEANDVDLQVGLNN